RNKMQQRHMAGALDSLAKRPLMVGARTAASAGDYLSPFRYKFSQPVVLLVIYDGDFFNAECAHLASRLFELARRPLPWWWWHIFVPSVCCCWGRSGTASCVHCCTDRSDQTDPTDRSDRLSNR